MMGYGMMGGGAIMMFFWVILLGVLIYFALKNSKSNPSISPSRGLDAMEIAQSRLAKGEISIEEFEQIKNALQ